MEYTDFAQHAMEYTDFAQHAKEFEDFAQYVENWLSPVIQATWEVRTEGWLEKEGCFSLADRYLWPHYGQPAWKVKPRRSSSHEDTEDGWLHAARIDGRQFEPSQTHSSQTQFSTVIVLQYMHNMCRNIVNISSSEPFESNNCS